MMSTLMLIVVIVILMIVVASYMSYKSDKDRELYSCYLRMTYKGIANGHGCVGNDTPKCKTCYYHKLYLKYKGE